MISNSGCCCSLSDPPLSSIIHRFHPRSLFLIVAAQPIACVATGRAVLYIVRILANLSFGICIGVVAFCFQATVVPSLSSLDSSSLALVLWPHLGSFELFGIVNLGPFFLGEITRQGIIKLAIVNRLATSFSWEDLGLVKVSSKYLLASVWRLAWVTQVTQVAPLS